MSAIEWPDDGVGVVVLVTRRTKRMNWRRHKRWIGHQLVEAVPMDIELRAFLLAIAIPRARALRHRSHE